MTCFISRKTAEITVAILTILMGGVISFGALEFGILWTKSGPEGGVFPFYVGLIIILASGVNIARAIYNPNQVEPIPFLTHKQARLVLIFAGPILAFVTVSLWLGLYVGSVLYLAAIMRIQGGYPLWKSVLTGLGTAVFFYVVLEKWFQVPLLKGPLESFIGLH